MREAKHDEWREKVGRAVVEVIAREGLAAATVRRIAAELGVSTMVVSHHFSNKQEMLLLAYRRFTESARERFDQVHGADPKDLAGFLVSMSPLDPQDLGLWRAYVAIWDTAMQDPVFNVELSSWVTNGLVRIETFVKARNPECADPVRVAAGLLALVQGIAVQLLFVPTLWSAAQLRAAVESAIEDALGPPSAI